jgi:hypothetical protein
MEGEKGRRGNKILTVRADILSSKVAGFSWDELLAAARRSVGEPVDAGADILVDCPGGAIFDETWIAELKSKKWFQIPQRVGGWRSREVDVKEGKEKGKSRSAVQIRVVALVTK